MKVLIITPSYKPAFIYGGPIFSVAYLAENLSKQNNVLVLSTRANGKSELEVNTNEIQNIEGVNVLFFNRQTKDHTHLSLDLLSYLWNNGNKYEVIHIQSWWNLVALFSGLICKIRSWNYIVSPRGMLSPYTYQASTIKKIIHVLLGNFLLKSAKVHLTSIDEQKKVLELNASYKTFVVPNFVDTDVPYIKKSKSTTFRILFLGRIHQKKGLDILLKSLNKLEFNFELNIVGEGESEYLTSLKNIINEHNLFDKVNWLGAKHGIEKYEMYAHSDLMVLPSHDENFANSVLESLLQGTPVILSTNVGLSNFVNNNNLGWVYQGYENELAVCINNAYLKTELREQIENNARAIILKEFDAIKLTKEYITNYKI